jgi:hypothetical protein
VTTGKLPGTPDSWINRLDAGERAALEQECSRATETMPELLYAIVSGQIGAAYVLLADYGKRNELGRRFSGFAVHALVSRSHA